MLDAAKHRPGWVYILSNDALSQAVLKIGKSEVDCHERMRSVAAEFKVPGKWRLEFRVAVRDVVEAELAVHRALDRCRLRWEFFRLSLDRAKAEVNRVTRPWRCTHAEVETPTPRRGATYQVPDRAARAKAAAEKAVLRRKRRQAALKAVATRRVRQAAAAAATAMPETT